MDDGLSTGVSESLHWEIADALLTTDRRAILAEVEDVLVQPKGLSSKRTNFEGGGGEQSSFLLSPQNNVQI